MEYALQDVKAICGSYSGLISEIGSKTIEERFDKLKFCMCEFIKDKNAQNLFYVNQRILMISILDFFTDIQRLKSFHQHVVSINEYKAKAYESSWILRRKPIQVIGSQTIESDEYDYINEQFVLTYIMDFLTGRDIVSKLNKVEDLDKAKYFASLKGFLNTLLYYLKFRDCGAQEIELMLMAFDAGRMFKELEIL